MLDMFGLTAGGWSSVLNLLVYALMLVLFVLGICKCVIPVLNNRKLLKRAVRNIRAGQDAKRSWQDDKFLGKGTLFAHWSEYLNNLFFADGAYHNPSNVEDYINEETVIQGPGRSAFSDAIPGVLVSLGFLGTLIGIAAGLSGFDMTDSAAVQNSIVTLIPGMRYAFMTSIVGVVLSVSFNLITRMVNGSAVHALDSFYAAMSRYAGVLSVDPMTQIAIYQQEQTGMIRTLTEEITGKLSADMRKAIMDATRPMTEAFQNFVTVSTQEQMRFLDRVVARFVDRMDSSLSGQFSHLAQVIDQACKDQEKSLRTTEESITGLRRMAGDLTELQKTTDSMLSKLESYTGLLEQSHSRSEEVVEKMASGLESIDIVARQQMTHLKNVNNMQREMMAAMEEFRAASSTFMHQMHESTASAAEGMHMAADELHDAGSILADTQKQITGQINADLRDAFDNFEQYMAEFTRTIDQVARTIADSVGALPGAVNQTSDRFLDEMDRLTDSLRAANDRFGGARR